MPEETLFESEADQRRADVAAYFRAFAEKLESGGDVTLSAAGESITVTVPDTVEFEVEVEREGKEGKPGELSIEFELEWDEDAVGAGGDGSLRIE
ncbi:amphi-Trp domain-containing protein [Salinirubellus salinus]|uniref:Amphi-Trp domain-containing protein n=1 Tax=Salinirubellus salinus TaxID=1364945 RepID=A0A9E7R4L6_9EURY|nr:amphi-Trp domain-containing protein [Salinirubellus salinus]UWM55273.1 amphi-Trp domain-containing protein [Salinirubellus salinus]